MSEQNKHEPTKAKKKLFAGMSKEKRFYLLMAIGCAALLLAIVIVAIAIAGNKKTGHQLKNSVTSEISSGDVEDSTSDEPVIITPEGMISPLETATVGNDFGFYYNQTLNTYYEHAGVDFTAAAGTNVLAADDGTIESIFKEDLLTGTEIVINHGSGLKTVYRFVSEVEGLKVGDVVQKGDVIATVAEATGEEYKDGAHLHFEVLKNSVSVDPANYLTLEEK
ncbi:MAG: M23 family metallopeptidase [Clostridia bacterium]|nr:M23 family metallopeptidase [Clostridia bacterium]